MVLIAKISICVLVQLGTHLLVNTGLGLYTLKSMKLPITVKTVVASVRTITELQIRAVTIHALRAYSWVKSFFMDDEPTFTQTLSF